MPDIHVMDMCALLLGTMVSLVRQWLCVYT